MTVFHSVLDTESLDIKMDPSFSEYDDCVVNMFVKDILYKKNISQGDYR